MTTTQNPHPTASPLDPCNVCDAATAVTTDGNCAADTDAGITNTYARTILAAMVPAFAYGRLAYMANAHGGFDVRPLEGGPFVRLAVVDVFAVAVYALTPVEVVTAHATFDQVPAKVVAAAMLALLP